MNTNEVKIEFTTGADIQAHISEVADFRIKYFRDFPYLYLGNRSYEQKYLEGYAQDNKSILIRLKDLAGNLLAVSTALPLITSSDILEGAPELFHQNGFDPQRIYYYGEVILDYQIRGKGFARKIYLLQDQYAKANGFEQIAIATVMRDESDPRTPVGYSSADRVWLGLGFKRTQIQFDYHWPTICPDGSVQEILNPMVYWIKDLE